MAISYFRPINRPTSRPAHKPVPTAELVHGVQRVLAGGGDALFQPAQFRLGVSQLALELRNRRFIAALALLFGVAQQLFRVRDDRSQVVQQFLSGVDGLLRHAHKRSRKKMDGNKLERFNDCRLECDSCQKRISCCRT
jgi:hypothetical protein